MHLNQTQELINGEKSSDYSASTASQTQNQFGVPSISVSELKTEKFLEGTDYPLKFHFTPPTPPIETLETLGPLPNVTDSTAFSKFLYRIYLTTMQEAFKLYTQADLSENDEDR